MILKTLIFYLCLNFPKKFSNFNEVFIVQFYIFLSLYNINIDESVLDKNIGDFKIISNNIFKTKYEHLVSNQVSQEFLFDLNEDIRNPHAGEFYTREYAKYILIKECNITYPKNIANTEEKEQFDEQIREIKRTFDKFILTSRILSSGRLQVHNGYIFSVPYYACFQLHTSTTIEHIRPFFYSEKHLLEGYYSMNEDKFNCIIDNIKLLNILDNLKLSIPILYFTHCYNATNLFDRIIKLAIILECTMLANCRDELKYRLNLRTCNFLGKNVSEELSIFYDTRSSIVHCGDISNELYKKIKNIMQNKYNTNIEALFYFLQEKIEPIIRSVLLESLKIFNNSDKIKNYTQLSESIDKQIIKSISN